MKFLENIKFFVLSHIKNYEEDLSIFSKLISNKDYEYIDNYFKNEKDDSPKERIDIELVDQYKKINDLMSGSEEENYQLLEKLLDEKNTVSLCILGKYLVLGKGCKRDVKRGLSLIVDAAVKENPEAQYTLGKLYYDGCFPNEPDCFLIEKEFGRELNDRYLSAFWKYRAAMNGHVYAQFWYANDCEYGSYDCHVSNEDTLSLYVLSANQGYDHAIETLLNRLLDEKSRLYDKKRGIELVKKYIKNCDSNTFEEIRLILRKYNISLDEI